MNKSFQIGFAHGNSANGTRGYAPANRLADSKTQYDAGFQAGMAAHHEATASLRVELSKAQPPEIGALTLEMTMSTTFDLPAKLAICENGFGGLSAYELDPSDTLQAGDPVITVTYSDGTFFPGNHNEWLAAIRAKAIAAHLAGKNSIVV